MKWEIGEGHPLRHMFHGLVEQVFMSELGITNPRLADYVGEMLVEFVHVDRIYRLRTVDGQVIREVSRIEADSILSGKDLAGSERTRLINRYIGDFTLFWTGVYPENLRRMHRRRDRDDLLNYLEQGKRSYAIASDLSSGNTQPPARLLSALSEQFEYCVYGLGLVRKEWERSDPSGYGSMRLIWARG